MTRRPGCAHGHEQAGIGKERTLFEKTLTVSAQDMRSLAPIPDDVRWIAIAPTIGKACRGQERSMKGIAVDVDGGRPRGGSRHRVRIEQMGRQSGGVLRFPYPRPRRISTRFAPFATRNAISPGSRPKRIGFGKSPCALLRPGIPGGRTSRGSGLLGGGAPPGDTP